MKYPSNARLIYQLNNKKLPKEFLQKLDIDRLYENDEEFLDIDKEREFIISRTKMRPKVTNVEQRHATEEEFS